MLGLLYSLFHQILGVGGAFFQFARSLFKKINIFFLRSFFHLPPTSLEFGGFFCVLAKLDHLTCNKFSNVVKIF